MTSSDRAILLDTSVVIEPPRAGLPSGFHAISAITVAELEYGADVPDDLLERQRRRHRIRRLVDLMDVIPFDLATSEAYGLLAGLLRVGGRNPRPRRLDLLIAATAVRHRLALATRNPDDFRHLERALDVIPVNAPAR